MHSAVQAAPSRRRVWLARIISALPALLLLFSGVMKLVKPPSVVEGFAHFGYPESQLTAIGILEFACTIVYVIPRTAVLGAILVTAYLGGATATNVRVGDSYILIVVLGILICAGLLMREERLRALIPLRG